MKWMARLRSTATRNFARLSPFISESPSNYLVPDRFQIIGFLLTFGKTSQAV